MYGAKVPPYCLPIFLPVRIFSLEFIRKSLNIDQVYFVPTRKGYIFKLGKIVWPSIVNNRQALLQVEEMMKEFGFVQGAKWKYDPHHIIANKRGKFSFSPYIHEIKRKLRK